MTEHQKKLLNFYMENPSLAEDLDYEPDYVRLETYSREIKQLSDKQIKLLLQAIAED